MIAKAVREGWGVRKELKDQLIERMAEIVQTKAVPVPDSMGNVHDRVDVANNHAIAAARVLAAVDQVDQDDYWNADKNTRLDEGKSTENVQFAAGVINRLPLPESLSDGK